MSKVVLGRGLEALFQQNPEAQNQASVNSESIRDEKSPPRESGTEIIPLDHITPNRLQPRQTFNSEKLTELAASIKQNGLLQPLLVTRSGGAYMLVAGERRWRAAREAGLTSATCVVVPDLDDTRLLQLALIENIQREDLNPLETAQAYRELLDRFGMSQAELASRVGKSRPAISNSLRLLSLPDEVQKFLHDGRLTEGHARAILALNSSVEQIAAAKRVVDDSLSVRQAEDATRRTRKRRLIPKHKDVNLQDAESFLKRAFGTAVRIKPGLKRGVIEIDYYGVEDLNRVLELCQRLANTSSNLSF